MTKKLIEIISRQYKSNELFEDGIWRIEIRQQLIAIWLSRQILS
jgi:hypothetical protein